MKYRFIRAIFILVRSKPRLHCPLRLLARSLFLVLRFILIILIRGFV